MSREEEQKLLVELLEELQTMAFATAELAEILLDEEEPPQPLM